MSNNYHDHGFLVRIGIVILILLCWLFVIAAGESFAQSRVLDMCNDYMIKPSDDVTLVYTQESYESEYLQNTLTFTPKLDGIITFTIKCSKKQTFECSLIGHTNDGEWIEYYDWPDKLYLDTIPKTKIGNSVVFGVKKGHTYSFDMAIPDVKKYRVISSFSSKSESGGKTKKIAKTIKPGKHVEGLLPIGSKSSKWYKVKLKKRNSVFNFEGNGNDTIYYQLVTKGKKPLTRSVSGANWAYGSKKNKKMNKNIKKIKCNFKKGTTIYIHVFTEEKKSSGAYHWWIA